MNEYILPQSEHRMPAALKNTCFPKVLKQKVPKIPGILAKKLLYFPHYSRTKMALTKTAFPHNLFKRLAKGAKANSYFRTQQNFRTMQKWVAFMRWHPAHTVHLQRKI